METPPQVVLGYADQLAGQVAAAAPGQLRAAYLHGSAVLGGWTARSDVDLLLVTGGELAGQALARVEAALLASVSQCPGRDLECSVVSAAQAARPSEPWPFQLHIQARAPGAGPPGAQRAESAQVLRGTEQPGDADLLMHYAVARSSGWPVVGPPPATLIGAIPREVILGYLASELDWGREHGQEAYCVLNACRALVFLADGLIVSKLAGGQTALRRGGPAALIQRALDQQRGLATPRPPGPDAAGYALTVAATLRAAAAGPPLPPAPPGATP